MRSRGIGSFSFHFLVSSFLTIGFSLLCPEMMMANEKTAMTFTWEGPVFTDINRAERPEEILERDGKQYRLISARIRTAVKEEETVYASVTIPFSLEGGSEPPETAWVMLKDEGSGEEYEREVPRIESKEKERIWRDDFCFSVTIEGYDADAFRLGEAIIPANADLASYGLEFLKYLGLEEEYYRVEDVEWSGESYERDGTLCRDAKAKGSKLIRNVEVTYGGQTTSPRISGKQYLGIYEEILPFNEEPSSEGEEETIVRKASASTPETAPKVPEQPEEPEKEGIIKKAVKWLKTHMTVVTVSAGLLLVLTAALLLSVVRRKRKNKERE